MTRYVAICCRISKDKSGRTEGVKAQEKWGRKYAADHWPDLPVEVFADGNNSAMKPDGQRPEHDRFREWLNDGRIAQVWAVEQSRLERDEVRWFELAAQLDAAGIAELHTNRDGVVRVRDEVAGIKAVLNAGEVRKMRRRINDRLDEIAAAGLPSGGRHMAYRHAKDAEGNRTLEIIPDVAEHLKWAADKILSGWSRSNVTAELGRRGLLGPRSGKALRASTVKSALVSPTIAGLRMHRGRVVGPGNWEPILSEATWLAVKARLEGDRVVERPDGTSYAVRGRRTDTPGRRYLTTGGLAACGVCGAPLIGTMKKFRNRRESKPYLLCHPMKGGRACVGILLEPTEAWVVDQLWLELDKPEFLDAITADDHAGRRDQMLVDLATLERKRGELMTSFLRDGLTEAEWKAARREFAEQERALRDEIAAVPPPAVDVDIEAARSAWDDMTLDEQREFVRLFVQRVTIMPAKPGTRGFDPERVRIAWRTA
jgi:DNA invertase Pin-like site-specific DNA recombinase